MSPSTRRRFLSAGCVALAGTAGCLGRPGDGAGTTTSSPDPTTTTTPTRDEPTTTSPPTPTPDGSTTTFDPNDPPAEPAGLAVDNDSGVEIRATIDVLELSEPRSTDGTPRTVEPTATPDGTRLFDRTVALDPSGRRGFDAVFPVVEEPTEYWVTVDVDGGVRTTYALGSTPNDGFRYVGIDVRSPDDVGVHKYVV